MYRGGCCRNVDVVQESSSSLRVFYGRGQKVTAQQHLLKYLCTLVTAGSMRQIILPLLGAQQ